MKTEYKKIKDSIYKYQRSKKWLLAKIYSNQINNWKRKRWEIPSYTLSELKDKYIESIEYDILHTKWKESWYDKMLSPSIDRINPLLWYTLDNIQIMTFKENLDKGHNEMNITQWKRVLKKIWNDIVWKYMSITDAWKLNNISFQSISLCVLWKRKKAWWFSREYDKLQKQRLREEAKRK